MDTSRDDFVIAIRSAFLKKSNKQRFSLISLLIISLLFLILGRFNFQAIDILRTSLKELVYRSSFIVSIPENYVKNSFYKVQNHFLIYNKYEKAIQENNKLKAENFSNLFLSNENKRLKKILDDFTITSDAVVAKVLIDKNSPFLRSVVLNKGSKDDIKLGMAVLDGEYLIGKVVEVNFLTSRTLLLSDLNSKIPIVIEPGGFQSILSGTGGNDGNLQYIKDEYDFSSDSIVFSSGSGGIFKAGIPIGKLNNFSNTEKSVTFFSDFTQLQFVKVKKFEKEIQE